MSDREKVIKGMECCLVFGEDLLYKCDECPYRATEDERKVIDWRCHLKELRKDALELLKAQEPRVLTLEEVHEMAWDYCYLEEEVIKDKVLQIYSGKYRIKCITWPSIASCVLTFGDNAYGKRWRCWTSRPTDEQRKAVKWDD